MDLPDACTPLTIDDRLAAAAEALRLPRSVTGDQDALARALEEFGGEYQIEPSEFCYVAVRRPTVTCQEVITGRNPPELLTKLRAERDGGEAE